MKKTLVILPLIVLAACSSKEHPTQTKDWYMKHDAERQTRVKECRNDAAQMATPDCQNATNAEQDLRVFGKPGSDNSAPKITP
ncbi:hypothetical protein WT34_24365 [Burkholderia stagnalis]|uniref:EexN family lipoprotein n=1 Tax=Burkholderia stagnalis TaxID=1503054 RepID=UPI00075B9624|nr:EexN family lipoprotein [Burkholderia stagnalis]KVX69113.1 hypothetical protein WT34_24365 [Burkholderia stagnalis]